MKPNQKKIRRLKRNKIPYTVFGNLVVVESETCRVITGKKSEIPRITESKRARFPGSDRLLSAWMKRAFTKGV